MKDCDGEVKTMGIARLGDPIGSNLTYMPQCLQCKRWGGQGSSHRGYKGSFVAVQFIEEELPRSICSASIQASNDST